MKNKPNTTCRVCGKEYFCCGDSRKANSWRTMACCPEHFQEYMKQIEMSRKTMTKTVDTTSTKTTTKKTTTKTKVANNDGAGNESAD